MSDPTYDTPDVEEVLQSDEPPSSVPVTVVGPVLTEELPTRTAALRGMPILAGERAIKLCNADPRRKRVILWTSIPLDAEQTKVCVGTTEEEANNFSGALVESPNAISRYELTYAGELWGRACIIVDTVGIFENLAPSLQDIYLSIVTEQWAN